MDNVDINDLKVMLNRQKAPSVSIYLPTIRKGPEVNQNQIRFKNALGEAENQISERREIDDTMRERLLYPARKKLAEKQFWLKQDQGLAAFLSPDMTAFYRTPLDFKPLVTVNDRFHLKPLLPLFVSDALFYLLAVTQKKPQLFECTQHSLQEIKIEQMPDGITEVLQYDLEYAQLQFRTGTGTRGRGEKHAAIYHGQGGADTDNEQIMRYFQAIDKAIHPFLRDRNHPLLFAGLDHFFAFYKQANSYPYFITENALTKDPNALSPSFLHEHAWEIMASYFSENYRKAVETYSNYKGTGKTGADLRHILESAVIGRVDYLIVGVGVHQWGSYNPLTHEIEIHEEKEAFDEDLLDLAAFLTLTYGGNVFAVAPDAVPDGKDAVAFYRF